MAATLVLPGGDAQILWQTDVRGGREAARETNRPVLLEFWATWCGPCRAMDEHVFTEARVAAAMRKVVPVRVDIDRDPALSRQYEVEATPTFILTDGYGNELFRHRGMLAANQMLALLQALPADISRVHALAKVLEADKGHPPTLVALGHELRRLAMYSASTKFYRRALRTRAGRQPTDLRAEALLGTVANHVALKQLDDGAKLFDRFRREFPGKSSEPEAVELARVLGKR